MACHSEINVIHCVHSKNIVACYTTEDAVLIVNSFYYKLKLVVTTITYTLLLIYTAYTPISSLYPQ
jgi:hypothetical protein